MVTINNNWQLTHFFNDFLQYYITLSSVYIAYTSTLDGIVAKINY